jgi:hypothetical protein
VGLGTDRLEGTARIQERPFGKSCDEPKRRGRRRLREEAGPAEVDEGAEEGESHQVDDLA